MNFRLAVARHYIPGAYKRRKLAELFGFTAEAFERAVPDLDSLSLKEMLRRYALFTRQEAANFMMKNGDVGYIQQRLFERARRFGATIRNQLVVSSYREAMIAARILYRNIGIDFRSGGGGEVEIKKCYFSMYYPPEVCRLISALDEGIIAGLTGNSCFDFSERITEGYNSCKAKITPAL